MTFFAPNPGVLYPAVYDLAERVLAAAKSTRPFAQSRSRAGAAR
jgi:CRISPR-associated protein Cmr2